MEEPALREGGDEVGHKGGVNGGIEGGIEGLVPSSVRTCNKRIKHPAMLVEVGDLVEAKVLGEITNTEDSVSPVPRRGVKRRSITEAGPKTASNVTSSVQNTAIVFETDL